MKCNNAWRVIAMSVAVQAAIVAHSADLSCKTFSDNVFFEEGGTVESCGSFAAAYSVTVPTDGVYRITAKCPKALCRVIADGRFDCEFPDGFPLKAGKACLEVYVKASTAKGNVDAGKLVLDCPQLSTSRNGKNDLVAFCPGRRLEWDDQIRQRYIGYATFEVDAEEDGVYVFSLHQRTLPSMTKCFLDGKEVFFARSNYRDARFDQFFNTQRVVVRLAKGRHVFDFGEQYGNSLETGARCVLCDLAPGEWGRPWPSAKEGVTWPRQCVIGFSRADGRNPNRDTAYMLRGLDAMVFAEGDKAVIDAATAAPEARTLTLFTESPKADDGTRTTNAAPFSLVANKPAALRLDTSCEGGWRYWVADARGTVVHGPWSYAVAGTARDASHGDTRPPVVVDSVDCAAEGEGGPHDFRDNGTSRIVRSPKGDYRLTGSVGFRGISYHRKTDDGFLDPASCKKNDPGAVGCGASPDWFAYTLVAKHPGRTHVVRCTLPNDKERCVPIYVIDRKTGTSSGWIVQAGVGPASGDTCELAFFVWPNTPEVDVMVFNSTGNRGDKLCREGAVVRMELLEYPDGLPRLEEPVCGWNSDREFGWTGEQTDIGPFERTMVETDKGGFFPVFGGSSHGGMGRGRGWDAAQKVWKRFSETGAYFGQNFFSFPCWSYGMTFAQGKPQLLMLPANDAYGGQTDNPIDRDMLRLMLLEMSRTGVKFVADWHNTSCSKVNVPPQMERIVNGKWGEMNLCADASGVPAGTHSTQSIFNPAHPGMRKWMEDLYAAYGERYGDLPAFAGIRQRFWKSWPGWFETWFWREDLGFDDFTVGEFSKATGIALEAVGHDEAAFVRRKRLILERHGDAWRKWRAKTCLSAFEGLKRALNSTAPDAKLVAVEVSGSALTADTGLDPAVFGGRRDIGFCLGTARAQNGANDGGVEWNYCDPFNFYNFNRRTGAAANPPKDRIPAQRMSYPMGLCCLACQKASPYHLETAARALAENNLDRLIFGGPWTLPGADETIRKFVRVWRAIPTREWNRVEAAGGGGAHAPVVVWQCRDGADTLFFAVNRTDRNRRFVLRFDGKPKKVVDCVTGKDFSDFSLAPFMPVYCRAVGCAGISRCSAGQDADEIEAEKRAYAHLASIAAAAKDAVEVQSCAGEELVPCGFLGRADLTFTWEELFAPIRKAAEAEEWGAVADFVAAFERDHLWWYDRFGYPEGWKGQRYEAPKPLPRPVDKWLAIGPFGTAKPAKELGSVTPDVFPPETEGVVPGKAYKGLLGIDVAWKKVQLDSPRSLALDSKTFPVVGRFRKNVACFLATWIYSPEERTANLYAHCDYFWSLKVNDKVVVKGTGGPNQRYSGPIKASLKKGWNAVLVRAEPGTSNWNFGLAIDDFDGLEFSAEPR